MMIRGSTALVTGANRGLGSALVRALRTGGCAKIYAAARNIAGAARDGVVHPVQLDITSAEEVAAAAAHCQDVDILINNAGVAGFKPALGTGRSTRTCRGPGTTMCAGRPPRRRSRSRGAARELQGLNVKAWSSRSLLIPDRWGPGARRETAQTRERRRAQPRRRYPPRPQQRRTARFASAARPRAAA